jgi:alpha-glucosidase
LSAWWRDAVVYQIYVRSFADGDGDGTGDIAGMRSRLGYLHALGVDAVWLNPWYRSPLHDGGYDVADYREIDERFGSTAAAEAFIAAAAEHDIRVIVDLVPNHTSSEHAWFREALASAPGSEARSRYHFLDGRGPAGEQPPNDWRSVFGGAAWTRVPDGQWYLHLFDESQPDVNWNHHAVADEFEAVMRFWLDRGAAGFRMDVAHALTKAPGYPGRGLGRQRRKGHHRTGSVPGSRRSASHRATLASGARRVRRTDDGRRGMGGGGAAPAVPAAGRVPPGVRLRPVVGAVGCRAVPIDHRRQHPRSERGRSNSTWVLSNHDVVRHATRYGLPADVDPGRWLLDGPHELLDAERGVRRARAAALLTFALPGSVYVYQGDELGLPEAWDLPVEVLQDPIWTDSGHTVKGRDGCRVPIPWEPTGPSLGFGDAGAWLPQPQEFARLAAATQADDPNSTLTLYRRALALRRERLASRRTVDDEMVWLDLGADVIAFECADGSRCVVNMGTESVPLPPGDVAVASGTVLDGCLPPDTAVWLT